MGPALQAATSDSAATEPSPFPAPHLNSINHHGKPPRRLNGLHTADLARLNAVRSSEPSHAARFIKEISGTVWSACRLLTASQPDARHAFAEVMKALSADRFARLAAYSGRSTLDTFVALTVRDLLAERMLRLLQSDRMKA